MPPTLPAKPRPRLSREHWTVGELARRTNCTLRTIRFYEEQGLLEVEERTEGRHRRYSRRQFERLSLIAELRRSGLSLEEIRSVIDVKRRHATGAIASAAMRDLLDRQISAIQQRLAELERLSGELQQLQVALSNCRECHEDRRFPDACADCEKLAAVNTDTSLIRTLWSHSR